MPTSNIVINMAPADIRKEGSAYDLPLAIGMLGASEVIRPDKLNRYLLMGELSLDGSLQPIKGALPIAIKARELGFEGIIIPKQNTREAAVVNNLKVYGAGNLKEVIEFFNDKQELELVHVDTRKEFYTQQNSFDLDFSDVKGQENVKRALEVAAAGGHNIMLLRQPLEDRKITISRVKCNVEFPTSFTLVASMNPCPCGYYNHPTKACVCSPGQVQKYLNRISGPLLDRIDLQIEVIPVPFEKMSDSRPGESSADIRERVVRARQIQSERYTGVPGVYCNAQMNSRLLACYARPDDKGLALLKNAMNRFNLSARAYDRILKVSRTIADLEGCESIQTSHLAEAIGYRNLDREDWAG